MNESVLEQVRRALERTAPLSAAPVPPEIDMTITRLVDGGADLREIFARVCGQNHMSVEAVGQADLCRRLAEYLRGQNVKRVAVSAGGLLSRLSIAEGLRRDGLEVRAWDELTLDQLYDFDCGVTDVDYAIAETGSVVVRASVGCGRALSLVPALHIAVVEESRLLPDLVDLFAVLGREGTGSAASIISGPSKTSDIEMTLVQGVHGPTRVKVYVV